MTNTTKPPCDDANVMRLWREAGLPEYFLGNGGTNHKLVEFARLIRGGKPAWVKELHADGTKATKEWKRNQRKWEDAGWPGL